VRQGSLVLAKHEPDLPRAHADVPRRHISELACARAQDPFSLPLSPLEGALLAFTMSRSVLSFAAPAITT
jgi:hypothetical protein